MYRKGEYLPISIVRKEANFDRACDEALDLALAAFGSIDGHLTKIVNAERDDIVMLEFLMYTVSSSRSGRSHIYSFKAWVG